MPAYFTKKALARIKKTARVLVLFHAHGAAAQFQNLPFPQRPAGRLKKQGASEGLQPFRRLPAFYSLGGTAPKGGHTPHVSDMEAYKFQSSSKASQGMSSAGFP